jgi:hypothetical protein
MGAQARSRLVDVVLWSIATVALVALMGSVALWVLGGIQPLPPGPVAVASASATTDNGVHWTEADTTKCKRLAGAAAENPRVPDGAMPPNPIVAEGFAGLATRVECHMSLKVTRLCNPTERAALVAEINDYLQRSDLVATGLAVQGAPMKIFGQLVGGEASAGSDIYQMERESTETLMRSYDWNVVTALRKLARQGLIAESDFGSFWGVPERITKMFGGTKVAKAVCA